MGIVRRALPPRRKEHVPIPVLGVLGPRSSVICSEQASHSTTSLYQERFYEKRRWVPIRRCSRRGKGRGLLTVSGARRGSGEERASAGGDPVAVDGRTVLTGSSRA
ncbi:hypothetical protein Sdia_08450 [Streptomyces diastaticus subsp. diastaticus]|uniref:Uncharacterized protein n=1 Tax=Streptomyces diastaticus subsp. diastaticus TaxID=68040 RepID=A0ABQ1CI58_STRDI|nr:hypothetical protein Sdia_08450 [Streptomyces diastaticus subsp. diastaticus]GGU47812.1 hypothetical protein GCM10015534_57800 [Streptomyces diastaticus subsp. diastaticus]